MKKNWTLKDYATLTFTVVVLAGTLVPVTYMVSRDRKMNRCGANLTTLSKAYYIYTIEEHRGQPSFPVFEKGREFWLAVPVFAKQVHHRRVARHFEDPHQFFADLSSDDESVRLRAVKGLVKLNRDALNILVDLIDDPSGPIVELAFTRLVELATPSTTKVFRRILRDPKFKGAWNRSLEVLTKMEDPYAREVIAAVVRRAAEDPASLTVFPNGDRPEQARWLVGPAIIASGGPFRDKQTLVHFRKMFEHSIRQAGKELTNRSRPWDLRVSILLAVSDWEEALTELRPLVIESLGEADPTWLPQSVEVVLTLKPKERITEIRKLLADRKYRVTASRLIVALGDTEAVPLLLKILKAGSTDPELRPTRILHDNLAAAWALGRLGSVEAVPSLMEIWKLARSDRTIYGHHTILPSILIALGRTRDNRAVRLLIESLEDPLEEVRYAASEALGMIGDKQAVSPLVSRLDDIIGFDLYDDDPTAYEMGLWWNMRYLVEPYIHYHHRSRDIPVVRPDAVVREAVLGALESITGTGFKGTPSKQAAAWKEWWELHKDGYR